MVWIIKHLKFIIDTNTKNSLKRVAHGIGQTLEKAWGDDATQSPRGPFEGGYGGVGGRKGGDSESPLVL